MELIMLEAKNKFKSLIKKLFRTLRLTSNLEKEKSISSYGLYSDEMSNRTENAHIERFKKELKTAEILAWYRRQKSTII